MGARPDIFFVVNIDSDPDPEDTPRDDLAVMKKYRIMKRLVDERIDGKGTICVQTSPIYRDRFFESHFLDFWREWVSGGGDLTLHPEEDLYATPETRLASGSYYSDASHMEAVIRAKVELMNAEGLPFAAYKGGYHGLTMDIVRILESVGISIDLTCAPGIEWPEKLALWGDAPKTAYAMSRERCAEPAAPGASSPVFEIPFGWDGEHSDTTRRLLNEHYLVNEFSNYGALCRVWDHIVARAHASERAQIVSFLCHTYALQSEKLRRQCGEFLDYMRAEGGIPVTATEARQMYHQAHDA